MARTRTASMLPLLGVGLAVGVGAAALLGARWWLYFGLAMCGAVAGLLTWMVIATMRGSTRWLLAPMLFPVALVAFLLTLHHVQQVERCERLRRFLATRPLSYEAVVVESTSEALRPKVRCGLELRPAEGCGTCGVRLRCEGRTVVEYGDGDHCGAQSSYLSASGDGRPYLSVAIGGPRWVAHLYYRDPDRTVELQLSPVDVPAERP